MPHYNTIFHELLKLLPRHQFDKRATNSRPTATLKSSRPGTSSSFSCTPRPAARQACATSRTAWPPRPTTSTISAYRPLSRSQLCPMPTGLATTGSTKTSFTGYALAVGSLRPAISSNSRTRSSSWTRPLSIFACAPFHGPNIPDDEAPSRCISAWTPIGTSPESLPL